jgi:hypothetical protein
MKEPTLFPPISEKEAARLAGFQGDAQARTLRCARERTQEKAPIDWNRQYTDDSSYEFP